MFRLLGFDVHVRMGFVMFLGLIVFLYPGQFGIWLAAALAGFTLLHELGHAVAARSAGAQAEISLDFMAGYTSFRAPRELSTGRRALISAAGPVIQIVAGVAILAAMGVNAVSFDSVRAGSDVALAVWWAGPAIGVLNLIPVLPLDGGHLVLAVLRPLLGERSLRVMAIASIILTIAGTVWLSLTGRPTFSIFVLFLVIGQIQILQSTSQRPGGRSHPIGRAIAAERLAWETGTPGMLEPGQQLSPWFHADQALAAGDAGGAMGVLLADLRQSGDRRWVLPPDLPAGRLQPLVDVLPADLPIGNPMASRVLAEVLIRVGDVRRGGEYAAAAFATHRTSTLATIVAVASAAVGEDDNAVRWLAAASDAADGEPSGARLALRSVLAPGGPFDRLRDRPDFSAIAERV